MKTKNSKLTSLEQFIDQKIGKIGTEKRKKFENEYALFKLRVLIKQARENRE